MLKLYKNIKDRRNELRLTQEQLAQKMGYSDKGMISKIEKGLIDISHTKIIEFAEALNTTPRVLMGWDDNEAAIHSTSQLRPDEQELLDKYGKLNDTGKKKLAERADELLEVPSYTVTEVSKKREA